MYLVFLILALILANAPCVQQSRFLLVIRVREKKLGLILLEWLIYYGMLGILARYLEFSQSGEIHSQDWEFYVATPILFITFASPSIIYKYAYKC